MSRRLRVERDERAIRPKADRWAGERDFSAFIREITGRKRTEAGLRDVNQTLNTDIESSPLAISVLDRDLKVQLWNPAAERLFGWSRAEVIGRPWPIVPRKQPERFRAQFAKELKGKSRIREEVQRVRKDGSSVEVSVSTAPLRNSQGKITSVLRIIEDNTDRKRAAQALRKAHDELEARVRERTAELTRASSVLQREIAAHRQAEVAIARLASIVESSSDSIISSTLNSIVISWNKGAEQLYGYPAAEMIGLPLTRLVPRDQLKTHRELWNRLKRGETVPSFETVRLRKDGTRVEVSVTLSPIRDASGRLSGFTHISRDVTEGRRSERAIQASETRNLARGLYPVEAEAHGLMSSLQALAEQTQDIFQIRCGFDCRRPVQVPDNMVATHLYRIAQEAVANAIRHGRARSITIRLSASPRIIILGIHDDGIGLERSKKRHQGMGLRIMQYRAGMIDATVVVQRRPGRGTSVVCTCPRSPMKVEKT